MPDVKKACIKVMKKLIREQLPSCYTKITLLYTYVVYVGTQVSTYLKKLTIGAKLKSSHF